VPAQLPLPTRPTEGAVFTELLVLLVLRQSTGNESSVERCTPVGQRGPDQPGRSGL